MPVIRIPVVQRDLGDRHGSFGRGPRHGNSGHDSAGTSTSSTRLFHSPQPGHRPTHFGQPVPHSVQQNTLRTLAMHRPYRGGMTGFWTHRGLPGPCFVPTHRPTTAPPNDAPGTRNRTRPSPARSSCPHAPPGDLPSTKNGGRTKSRPFFVPHAPPSDGRARSGLRWTAGPWRAVGTARASVFVPGS